MLLRDYYYSANKWRIVEIKKFSIGAGTTAVLVPKRLCLVVSSRSVKRQPDKLGRRWWKVWNKVLPGDRCRQSGVLVDQVCQRHEWVVPGIAARYREEPVSVSVCVLGEEVGGGTILEETGSVGPKCWPGLHILVLRGTKFAVFYRQTQRQ